MKRITLQGLTLTNFKGRTFAFSPNGADADVFGDNGRGKTTLADGYCWLISGKDSLGRADFEIKNLDADGNHEHGLDHVVEAELLVNGIPITLKKVYRETWTKKRGSAQAVLTGNTTDHFIDGVPVKENEYKTRITEIFGDVETARILTMPNVFPSLPWQKQRSLLLQVSGDVSDAQVIASDYTLEPLTEMLKKYTVSKNPIEDLKKVVSSRRTEINRQIDQLPIRIDEVRRGLPDITGLNLSEIDAEIQRLETAIGEAKLNLQGIDNGGDIARWNKELQSINADISRLENAHYEEGMKVVRELNQKIQALIDGAEAAERKTRTLKAEIAFKEEKVRSLDAGIERLKAKWFEVDSEEFQNTVADTCPSCGQSLPTDQVQQTKDKALAAFNLSKSERITEIDRSGAGLVAERDRLKGEIEKLNQELLTVPTGAPEEMTKLTEERDAAKRAAEDYSGIKVRAGHLTLKAGLEEKIEAAKNGHQAERGPVQDEIERLGQELLTEKQRSAMFQRRAQGDERIEALKAEEKKLAKEFEEMEQQLFLIESFTKAKVAMLNQKINDKFKTVRFKLFNQLMNGGIEDCCEITVNGVPFGGGLNHAGRTQAVVEIMGVLQKHYGISTVMWIDDHASIGDTPEVDCQTIRLFFQKNCTEIRVETVNKGRMAA